MPISICGTSIRGTEAEKPLDLKSFTKYSTGHSALHELTIQDSIGE